MKNKETIHSVQILRGIAAVFVMFFHYSYWGGSPAFPNHPRLQEVLHGGSLRINLFFIISGFIMFVTTGHHTDPVKFLIKRMIRIVPLYYITLFIFLSFNALKDWNTILSVLFIPIGRSSDPAPFFGYASYIVGWTLNYEVFFYLVVFISLYFKKYRFYLLASIFILLHLVYWGFMKGSFFDSFNPHQSPQNLNSAYLSMIINPMTLLFPIGLVIGWIYTRLKDLPKKWHVSGFLVSAIAIIIYCKSFPVLHSKHNEIATGFSILLMFCALCAEGFIKTWNKHICMKPLLYLGSISYSIYLNHSIILQYIPPGKTPFLNLLLNLLCTVVVSSVTYQLVEKRLTRQLRKWCKLARAERTEKFLPKSFQT